MKNFNQAAGKSLALLLSLGLLLPPSLSAQRSPGAPQRAPAPVGAKFYPVSLPNLTQKKPVVSPVSLAINGISPASPALVARHPVIDIINQIQEAGVSLPETSGSAADASRLIAAAQALKPGPAREHILAMARALSNPAGTGGSERNAAGLDEVYENGASRSAADAPLPAVSVKQSKGILAGLSRYFRGDRVPKSEPLNPDLFKVPLEKLRWVPDLEALPKSTRDVPEAGDKRIVGQDKALKALHFGLKMSGSGYNVYVSGPEGSGRETAVRQAAGALAATMPVPPDQLAATNFANKDEPVVLRLPAGSAAAFKRQVREFVKTMQAALPQALDSGKIGQAKKALREEFEKSAGKRMDAFEDEVAQLRFGSFGMSIRLEKNKRGQTVMVAPVWNGQTLSQEDIKEKLAAREFSQEDLNKAIDEIHGASGPFVDKLLEILNQSQKEASELYQKMDSMDRTMAAAIAREAGKPLMEIASDSKPASHDDAAHEKFEMNAKRRRTQWQAEVSAVRVGRFGLKLTPFETPEGLKMRVSLTLNGKEISSEEQRALIDSKEMTVDEWNKANAAKVEAYTPLIKKFEAMTKANEEEHEAIHASRPQAPLSRDAIKAQEYVGALTTHAADHYQDFLPRPSEAEEGSPSVDPLENYKVSILVSNKDLKGAPVVWEKSPSYENLFGSASDKKRVTDVPGVGMVAYPMPGGPTLKGGSFLRAHGGFLVLDVMDVLREPGSWQALMRAVRNGQAEIAEGGLAGAMTIRGAEYAVPAKVKVVLIGSPILRMLLGQNDDDFRGRFNAAVEFESALKIGKDILEGYVDFFKEMVVQSAGEVMDITREGMGAVLEFSARLAGGQERLSAQFGALFGLLKEATFWANESGHKELSRSDIEKALDQREERESGEQRHLMEIYEKNVFRVETGGKAVGQINGLAVMGSFGVPMRVTVVASAGAPGVVSIDREAGTTGSSYNKALGVVEGFLEKTFAQLKALSANIRISFEQNYGGIDGDSATSTEIYGILSSLSQTPIDQGFAVTGSADQFGNVQAIGGVNQKIEGFYTLCKAKGLTGRQGIVIPASNVGDLMLRPEVMQAVRDGKFHIYAVKHVSQGIEILTGVAYSEILRKAEARLEELRAAAGR